jgi:hypothetical protein
MKIISACSDIASALQRRVSGPSATRMRDLLLEAQTPERCASQQRRTSPDGVRYRRSCAVPPLLYGSRCLPPDGRDGPEAAAVRLGQCYRGRGDVTFAQS